MLEPSWMEDPQPFLHFFDNLTYFDNIHGNVELSRIEMDVIDTPEFQRLFRVSQLGLVQYVFRTGVHSRGAHCVGACHVSKQLMQRINQNMSDARRRGTSGHPSGGQNLDQLLAPISTTSQIVIALSALLHDLPHRPFSHDIEAKSHRLKHADRGDERTTSYRGPYPKHDDFGRNPALYLLLFDTKNSVLARVLRAHSPSFVELLLTEAKEYRYASEIAEFANRLDSMRKSWLNSDDELLAQLIFHTLAGEKPEDFDDYGRLNQVLTSWGGEPGAVGLGPPRDETAASLLHASWYQPYRHDIVGNTLSADLLDYLARDNYGTGLAYSIDDRFLRHVVLWPSPQPVNGDTVRYCVVSVVDEKRGTLRTEAVHDIFRLLEDRFDLQRKAILHRIVQGSVAMLWRAIALLGDGKPQEQSLYGVSVASGVDSVAFAGDERFLTQLLEAAEDKPLSKDLLAKLGERRIYRPLMLLPGDNLLELLAGPSAFAGTEEVLREFAAVMDSELYDPFLRTVERYIEAILAHGTTLPDLTMALRTADTALVPATVPSSEVIFWQLPYKQFYKDPQVRLLNEGSVNTLDELGQEIRDDKHLDLQRSIRAQILNADQKYSAEWNFSVYVSDDLVGAGVLADLEPGICPDHTEHIKDAETLAIVALLVVWQDWRGDTGNWRRAWLDANRPQGDRSKQANAGRLGPTSEVFDLRSSQPGLFAGARHPLNSPAEKSHTLRLLSKMGDRARIEIAEKAAREIEGRKTSGAYLRSDAPSVGHGNRRDVRAKFGQSATRGDINRLCEKCLALDSAQKRRLRELIYPLADREVPLPDIEGIAARYWSQMSREVHSVIVDQFSESERAARRPESDPSLSQEYLQRVIAVACGVPDCAV